MSDYQAGFDAGFRKGLSAVEAGFTAHDMAQAREEGYSAGVQRAIQHERILSDLIAELRARHEVCGPCAFGHPCRELATIDRAEARLREATE